MVLLCSTKYVGFLNCYLNLHDLIRIILFYSEGILSLSQRDSLHDAYTESFPMNNDNDL